MPPYRSALPTWLNNAYTESHIGLALRILAERESRRENIRSICQSRVRASLASSSSLKTSSPCSPGGSVPTSHLEHYSVAAAHQVPNLPRNRYTDVVPYDRTRVIVESGSAAGRYLNANWVLERHGHKWWIATQAPLPTTTHTFLSLIMHPIPNPARLLGTSHTPRHEGSLPSHDTTRIRTVVQLTKNFEGGRMKAHPYFPTEVGQSVIVPPDPGLSVPALKVTLLCTKNHEDAQCLQSTVAISPVDLTSTLQTATPSEMNGDESYRSEEDHDKRVIFQHLMYTAWPDHGVPGDEDRTSLLAFLKLVDRSNRDPSFCSYPPTIEPPSCQRQCDPDPPILVGCSAGIGRTGSFIALSSLLRHGGFLPSAATPTPTSAIPPSPLGTLPRALIGDLVVEEIDSLREQRPRMVERPEQTLLIYELLIRAFQGA